MDHVIKVAGIVNCGAICPSYAGMARSVETIPCALVVDDDFLIREEAVAILQTAGFHCLDAENGDSA